MTRTIRITLYPALLLLSLALLAACTGGDGDKAAPTPSGTTAGKPTLVFLWNAP